LRSRRDYPSADENRALTNCINILEENQNKLRCEKDIDILRGIEGQSAKMYFDVFDLLFTQQKEDFILMGRTKRPPLDTTNAMLSFLYTICTNDIASALECVGLDPYIGLFHTLRPGRVSLACDIMEEFRALIERLVIIMVNLKIIQKTDFEKQISGAIWLNDDGRKKVIIAWQDKKKECVSHPYLKEKIPIGLFPYVQANLLAKYVRGEIDSYPNLVWG
jgi:CRISPR-associated protein Cas1